MYQFEIDKKYNHAEFVRFLSDFLPDEFIPANEDLYYEHFARVNGDGESKILGRCEELDLEVYEFVHLSDSDPRVSLTKDVVSYLKNVAFCRNALVVFYSQVSEQWRLSLVTTDVEYKDDKLIRTYSNPKRYSFLLGKNCKKHTPSKMLFKEGSVRDFADLQSRFAIDVVTEQFYKELFAWYEWAVSLVKFPEGSGYNVSLTNKNNELHVIRLITRLLFVWFIKQKELVPDWVFDEEKIKGVLSVFDPLSERRGNYYNAIIQNLFFATLNKEINEREFADSTPRSRNVQYGVNTYYRDDNEKSFFKVSHDEVVRLFKPVPFLNGGLFECLDRTETRFDGCNVQTYIDGFSRESKRRAFVPNVLFWGEEESGHEGIVHLLNRYNFTVEENTTTEIDVALDPELLGRVFENLLGTYNPETRETARKDSGSFYTPREVVDFMVDESIKHYLSKQVASLTDAELSSLFSDDEKVRLPSEKTKEVCSAIESIKILDPACGSGAFPMGCLQRMVRILEKARECSDVYNLKLHLIKNCIYGIDIQPIAVQISKLRFFISLICEQKKSNNAAENYGIDPLPNLETKFVAANSLIGRKKNSVYNGSSLFENPEIEQTKQELQRIRNNHFAAKTAKDKKEFRKKDKELRERLIRLLVDEKNSDPEDARLIASWNPYDQSSYSPFFDLEWMFGINEGFDIVIGNPPYIQLQNNGGLLGDQYENSGFETFVRSGDIYCLFYEKGWQFLKKDGFLCYITSNKWMRAGYGEKTRKFFAEKTNPIRLVDFAGVKVFKSATVDTNILLFQKSKNQGKTLSCITKNMSHNDLCKLSDYIQQNSMELSFTTSDSWVILSPIEMRIKQKVESIGTPLKDWNIHINYGIKTGLNPAFIITTEKRNEILSNCIDEEERRRTEEIIRPILRGQDIERYNYKWAGLYLCWIPWHFPFHLDSSIQGASIKAELEFKKKYYSLFEYLSDYKDGLSKRNKEETGIRYEWYALQRWGANYWEEFYKPKIVYNDIASEMSFALSLNGEFLNNTAYFFSSYNIDVLKYLSVILNSQLMNWYYRTLSVQLGAKAVRMYSIYVNLIPVPMITSEEIQLFIGEYPPKASNEKGIDEKIFNLFGLTEMEREYIEREFPKLTNRDPSSN